MNERTTHESISFSLKLRQEELLDRCADANDLLEPIITTSRLASLKSMRPLYSVGFEFSGKRESLSRLEVYFDGPAGGLELERSRHRWYTARRGDENTHRQPLQLGVMDFLR